MDAAGWEVAYDGMEFDPVSADCCRPTSCAPRCTSIGAERYHIHHPFHRMLHDGG